MENSRLDRWLVSTMQKNIAPANVRVALESQEEPREAGFGASPRLRINDRRTLVSLLTNPQMAFGDAYSEGRIEIEGDLVRVLEDLYQVPDTAAGRLVSRWLTWAQPNSMNGSRRNIHRHYDLSNDFYRLWLDSEMVYTCAYFPEPETGLEEAQEAKMELVCRKLWLRPGDLVVEAGCGWGALALYMARHYGVRVKAFNISQEQMSHARERARAEGLSSRVEFIEDDYRNIREKADVFVSIGMLEHVGRDRLQDFGRVIHRTIGDQGRGLLHFIGRNYPQPLAAWIRKRIFPGGYTPTLKQAMEVFEPHDFGVLDVENLRFHYARTLECWLSRYEQAYAQVERRFGSIFARMWRLYLAGSIAAFRVGSMQLFQVAFAGNKCQSQPWTRARLYAPQPQSAQREQAWIRAIS
ncbi:MAG: cyclopropane-fatty-acyl-phospholipid synthase family protein [Acidobacteriia bacterium]|nr:cyclopropane-fatty-acyl-phospholipid synthase family protein [Terriglobia bacterium]